MGQSRLLLVVGRLTVSALLAGKIGGGAGDVAGTVDVGAQTRGHVVALGRGASGLDLPGNGRGSVSADWPRAGTPAIRRREGEG